MLGEKRSCRLVDSVEGRGPVAPLRHIRTSAGYWLGWGWRRTGVPHHPRHDHPSLFPLPLHVQCSGCRPSSDQCREGGREAMHIISPSILLSYPSTNDAERGRGAAAWSVLPISTDAFHRTIIITNAAPNKEVLSVAAPRLHSSSGYRLTRNAYDKTGCRRRPVAVCHRVGAYSLLPRENMGEIEKGREGRGESEGSMTGGPHFIFYFLC